MRSRRRLSPENRGYAERADHLVVAHVNNPQITFMRGALSRDRQDNMRIDRSECHINDFKFCARIFFLQKHFKIAVWRKTLCGISHRGGFSKNKNAKDAWRFVSAKTNRTRVARDLFREKPPTELLVLDEEIFVVDFKTLKKIRVITEAPEAQRNFDDSKQDKR